MTDSAFYDQLLRLRAIRSYRDDPVPDGVIEELLEAARWTGSSKNRQNWSFIVVDGDQKNRLAGCGDFTDPVRTAPIALALVEEHVGYEFDTGRVAQNVMLAADSLGLASCPITLHRDEDAAAVLGLPEGARCRYAISIGYPSPDAAPRRFGGRKPLGEVAYRNRHGNSWQGRD
ncbi:MAG: nitroreductase family protein [Actinomycetota bacterium]